jgi:hypothetical protein
MDDTNTNNGGSKMKNFAEAASTFVTGVDVP